MTGAARLVRGTAWVGGVALAVLALAASGHGALSSPPLGDPGRWPVWFEQREPAEAAFAILRLAAVGGCWYLATTTVVGALLRLFRADGLVAVVDRVTVAPVRHLLAGSLTLTLAGLGPTGVLAAAAQTTASTTTTTTMTTTTTEPATITMRRLPPPGDAPAPAAPPPGPDVAGRYTVVPGDCFWTIADDLLQRAWGRSPSDAEIVPYWVRLIDANRAELVDPGNADLIYPGQVFTVPPVPPPGG